jgi:Fe-S-cluster containining protein
MDAALSRRPVDEAALRGAEDLAQYVDDAIAIVQEEYQPVLACSEGCSHCCCKPGVLVSVPELHRILDYVDRHYDEDERQALATRADNYMKALDGQSPHAATDVVVPCPLLTHERCAVYELRPLTCRGYNSTDATACLKARTNQDVLVPIVAVVKDVADGATVGAATSLRRTDLNAAMVDLGTALYLACGDASMRGERLLLLSGVLTVAEHSTWTDDLWDAVRHIAWQCGVSVNE